MKAKKNQLTTATQIPVFPQTLHQQRPDSQAAAQNTKAPKRDNTFSKSRDTREDRGTREMKTSHNAQTLPHGR